MDGFEIISLECLFGDPLPKLLILFRAKKKMTDSAKKKKKKKNNNILMTSPPKQMDGFWNNLKGGGGGGVGGLFQNFSNRSTPLHKAVASVENRKKKHKKKTLNDCSS